MPPYKALPPAVRAFVILAIAVAVIAGAGTGLALAATRNIAMKENFTDFLPALPSRIYDIQGRLITEFFSEEKREIISIGQLPPHLINAIITREDKSFYRHRGFDLKRLLVAAIGVATGKNFGGGSTITQQVAGDLYADRHEISLKRKLVELWWALQLERRYTKSEILELYLNRTVMGTGVYGVEAASKYFFGHSARDISLAESAILVVQLSSPVRFDPFKNPNNARSRSRAVLDAMVKLGYATKPEADASFNEYWDNFDYTRVSAGAYFSRDDKAPWFSEYVRRQLDDMLYGSLDLYSDGFNVYTTLDLDKQALADSYMKRGIEQANAGFRRSGAQRLVEAEDSYIPILEMLGYSFNLDALLVSDAKAENSTFTYYKQKINPVVDAAALLFGLPDLKSLSNAGFGRMKSDLEKSTVEGALITVENETGYISSMVGGSRYDQSNQNIRAVQSRLMPGSTFKPLYYSAAIDSRSFTEASLIYDAPVIFYTQDGTPYMPLNFKGEWKGPVLLWYALAKSMNIPSLKVLDGIGFDAAIARAATLLDITDPAEIRSTFPRVYPLGLGIIGVSPLKMARAFSVFANGGKSLTPIAIRSVEDRQGRPVLEPEKELRTKQARAGSAGQLISAQNAAVMVDMLQRVVQSGTLSGQTSSGALFRQKDASGLSYTIPAAGKTGTTDNWADAWTVGFTPYMTTAIWFGFDRPGNSLGVEQTGAVLAGTIWSNYMRDVHKGLPFKDFPKPQSGLARMSVCAISGQVLTPSCNEGSVSLLFLEGTQPVTACEIHAPVQSELPPVSTIPGAEDAGGATTTLPADRETPSETQTQPILSPSALPDARLRITIPEL
jgi:penicillin-binding protein 1A